MAPEAAKRPGVRGPSPGGCLSSRPRGTGFGLRRDGGVLAWELGKIQQMWTCGRINHVLRLKIPFMGSAMVKFQFLLKSGK